MQVNDLMERIERRLKSANSVPVERVHITAEEWALIAKQLRKNLKDVQAPASGEVEPVGEVVHIGKGQTHGTVQYGEALIELTDARCKLKVSDLLYTRSPAASQVPEGYTPVRTLVLKWLLGETEAFEPVEGEQGQFWWRARLRDALLTTTPEAGDGRKCPSCGDFAYECDVCGGNRPPQPPQAQGDG